MQTLATQSSDDLLISKIIDTYGPNWLTFGADTLLLELQEEFGMIDVPEKTINYIMAMQAVMDPSKRAYIRDTGFFIAIAESLNHELFIPESLYPIEVHRMVAAVLFIKKVHELTGQAPPEFSHQVCAYIGSTLFEQQFMLVPAHWRLPEWAVQFHAAIVDRHIDDKVLLRKIQLLYESDYIGRRLDQKWFDYVIGQLKEESIADEQLRKMFGVDEYLFKQRLLAE